MSTDAEIVQVFYHGAVELRGRWWNRHWGRIARRDIWLMGGPDGWVVRACKGGDDGPEVSYEYGHEHEARAMVKRLIDTSPGDWRELTDLVRRTTTREPRAPEP